MFCIDQLHALEILDSRGRPTILAWCHLASGHSAKASVPSGASTGRAEAWELRDEDPLRYRGLGCRRAVRSVNHEIGPALIGQGWESQFALDRKLIELDGTPDKRRLGANAILAVSLAFARAAAKEQGIPLYRYFADMIGADQVRLPQLTVNLFSGGKHAGGQVEIQDVLIVPVAARSIDQGLSSVFNVYQAAAELMLKKYGSRALKADEGGLAPPFPNVDTMLTDAVDSIRAAGFEPGAEIALAIDVASSHFFQNGSYCLNREMLDSNRMIDQVIRWCESFPIVSVEDGLAEEDWNAWPRLRELLNQRAIITLGDDLLCSRTDRMMRAIETKSADALLLKVNQVGSVTEALQAMTLAKRHGWHVTASARSGETEDNWLADLAVGWSADQIKVGSITQSERLAKYNRLLEIESELNSLQ